MGSVYGSYTFVHLQEPHQILRMQIGEKFPHASRKWRGREGMASRKEIFLGKKMLELKTTLHMSKHASQHIISDELLYATCWGFKMYKTGPLPSGTQGLVGNA